MHSSIEVGVIVGSLRAGSHSRKVAHALIRKAPQNLNCRLIEIGDLPLYNEDLEDKAPAEWRNFVLQVRACRAVLFVTPEYNRSIPGCLKNAVDVGSRPQNESVWNGLPAGVVSVTPYKTGRLRGQSRASADICLLGYAGSSAARGVHQRCGRALRCGWHP
jgi:chromate reductase, NAD(P)H dehydrogenase (quinone)